MDKDDRKIFLWMFLVMVVVTIISAFWIALKVEVQGNDPMLKLKLAVTYALLVLIFLFGFAVLAAIASGVIDISKLLEDDSAAGGASTSRFQLLIFTFVIGMSFALIMASSSKLPDVPANVLALLGISASTYGVSKGIQAGSNNGTDAPKTAPKDPAGPTDPLKV
jgi:hypothetical protein